MTPEEMLEAYDRGWDRFSKKVLGLQNGYKALVQLNKMRKMMK